MGEGRGSIACVPDTRVSSAAPAASRRQEIVPGHDEEEKPARCHPQHEGATEETAPPPKRPRPERYSWAELMRRTYEFDVLLCPRGAKRRVLSLVCDPMQIRRVLEHMGLPTDPPQRAPPRPVQGVMRFA